MSASAFRGTYSDWRLVKTRGVIQVIFEIPLADADNAYQILGGMPDASKERWFGIAAISEAASKPKREWRDLPPQQQAGIRCEEPAFMKFLDEEHRLAEWNGFTTAEAVRALCGVKSRSELSTNHKARVIWHQLDQEYQAWLLRERVGA